MRLESVDYRLGDVTLHGVAAGSGPLALMFHGITGNGYVFTPVIEQLAQHFRCISLDQRGHGRSSKPATGYGAASFAEDIAGLVRAVGLGKALLIGHSLGARNGLVAACEHPELVAGVVAIDFVPFIETAVFDALDARVTGGDQVFPDLKAAQAYLANRYPKLPARAIALRAQYGMVAVAGGWRPLADPRAMQAISTGLREDLVPTLNTIRTPTLLIRGAESKLVSKVAWDKTHALRPDLPAIEIPHVDHYVQEENPDRIAEEVRQFWQSIQS
ncbi:MAG: alpha/beta hydrolase [Betaproteobacteria bacterium]|nr:alpha/beta hydrolase [Betaproteobacteria bacterium]